MAVSTIHHSVTKNTPEYETLLTTHVKYSISLQKSCQRPTNAGYNEVLSLSITTHSNIFSKVLNSTEDDVHTQFISLQGPCQRPMSATTRYF